MTDTPGLLRRPEDERNAMERLTLAALAYLPTAAVFVTDLTGDCGTSVADQWAIRCDMYHLIYSMFYCVHYTFVISICAVEDCRPSSLAGRYRQ